MSARVERRYRQNATLRLIPIVPRSIYSSIRVLRGKKKASRHYVLYYVLYYVRNQRRSGLRVISHPKYTTLVRSF